ncbi:MAG: Ig-like domain-containing protein [Sulfuricaulis sp.]
MNKCNGWFSRLWPKIGHGLRAVTQKYPREFARRKISWLALSAVMVITVTACSGGGGGGAGGSTATVASSDFTVAGTVMAPGGTVAFLPIRSLFDRFSDALLPQAYASSSFQEFQPYVSGISPVADGTRIDLVKIDDTGAVIATLASTTTSSATYSFDLTQLGLTPASNLTVQVTNTSTGARMRAFVGADGAVNLDPMSEASVRLVLDEIASSPGSSLGNFTTQELTDIASSVFLWIVTHQMSAGADIETTVSTFKNAVSADTGIMAFIVAASALGQTSKGPGDIGNYFPQDQGDTWYYSGTVSGSGLPSTSFNNTATFTGSKILNGVSVAVLSESNTSNAGPEETYLTKGTTGITDYGNNDAQDFLTSQVVPYEEIKFPQKIDSTFKQIDKSINWLNDLNGDGQSETAKLVSTVNTAGLETVVVTAGSFSNCVKVVAKLDVTITLSGGGNQSPLTETETDTNWYAPGVGLVKRSSVIEVSGQGVVYSETDQLTAYVVSGQANGVSVQVIPATASIAIGGTQQFTATAVDALNNPITGLTYTWNSSAPSVATIDAATGLATGVAVGTTQITASVMGIVSAPVTLNVIDQRQIVLPAKDLIYDPLRKQIYASVPGSAGTLGNTITVIDPETGTIGPSVFVGSEPGKLAISDDDQYLYVALDGAAAVRRVVLPTMTPDIQFTLGSDAFFGPRYAEDIEVLPGIPESVAVSRKYLGVSPRHAGVAIYDNGVARPTVTPDFAGSGDNINVIEFSASAARLYGYNNETTGFEFRRLNVDSSGVTILDSTANLISGFNVDIKFDNGLIYATTGTIIDPEARTIVGTCTLSSLYGSAAVRPDSGNNLVFFLEQDFSSQTWKIEAFNMTTFVSLGSLKIPGIPYNATAGSLIRWGHDGLAFRTDNDIYLVRSSLIP